MTKRFVCPHCEKQVSDEKGITLNVLNLNNTTKGTITFSKVLGDYTKEVSPELILKEKDQVSVQCPHCAISLNLERDPSKAVILMDEEGKESRIVFSAVVGEKTTYKFSPDGNDELYGNANPVFAQVIFDSLLWEQFTQ